MKVKNAAQVFSQRVSAVMHSRGLSGQEGIPATYCDTSDFLLFFDKLFDSVNGSSISQIDGKHLRVAVSNTSVHLEFWQQVLPVLNSIKFVSDNGRQFVPPTIHNWVKSIRALRDLWQKLQKEGFEFLCLRHFNQDPLEKIFGMIRSHGVRNINPTPIAFKAAFKGLLINNFMAAHSSGSNCEEDVSEGALDNLRRFLSLPDMEGVEQLEPIIDNGNNDKFQFQGGQTANKIELHAYLAGYVVKKLKAKLSCKDCFDAILSGPSIPEEQVLINVRSYNPRALIYTNLSFRKLFTKSCEVLHYFLPKHCHKDCLSKLLIAKLSKYVSDAVRSSCKQHNTLHFFFSYLVKFYIFSWIGNVNRILKGNESRDMNDDIKKMAYLKYTKRRGQQTRVRQNKNLRTA